MCVRVGSCGRELEEETIGKGLKKKGIIIAILRELESRVGGELSESREW